MTEENNQIKFFLYENWARTKTGQHTVEAIDSHHMQQAKPSRNAIAKQKTLRLKFKRFLCGEI